MIFWRNVYQRPDGTQWLGMPHQNRERCVQQVRIGQHRLAYRLRIRVR